MIYTVTLNPCIDKTYMVPELKEGGFSRATSSRTDLSGKGVNVSIDLGILGLKTVSTGFIGNADAERYQSFLKNFNADFGFVLIDGAVRINCKIIDLKTKKQTDVNESGPAVCEEKKQELLKFISGVTGEDTVIISGSMPPEFNGEDFEKLVSLVKQRGARLIIDTEKTGLGLAEKYNAFVIKPNQSEFCEYIGKQTEDINEIVEYALKKAKNIENIIISLGGDGSVFVRGNEAYFAKAENVNCLSTTGAGDALLSGFVFGITTGKSYSDAIRWAVSTASAKVENEGTKPPEKEKIEAFLNRVKITKIK